MAMYNERKISNEKLKPRSRIYTEALHVMGIRKDAQTFTWEDMKEGYTKAVESNESMTDKEKLDALEDLHEIVDMFSDYTDNIHDNFKEGTGFALFGNNDNGKTLMTSIWAREGYRHYYDAKVITAEEISILSRDFDNPEAKQTLEDLKTKYDFLVIDEIGKETEGKNKYNQIKLEEILKARIEKYQLPTAIVTNLSPEDFHKRYGNTIYSVIQYLQPIIITYSLYFRRPRKILRKRDKK